MTRRLNRRQSLHRISNPCAFEGLERRQLMSAGDLDLSFGNRGTAYAIFGEGLKPVAEDVAVQADGKTVVAGYTWYFDAKNNPHYQLAVARFNQNGTLDKTFGPEVVFQKAPPTQNASPFAGFQFFGEVNIEGQSGEMSVVLRDLNGVAVFEQKLQPV